MTSYYIVEYSGQAGGEFTEEGAFVTWNAGADSGFIVWDVPDGTAGKLAIAIIDGSVPPDAADTLTQGGVTADVDTSNPMLYPAYFRDDVAVAASGAITWTGPALGATHSLLFDGQTSNVVAGEILTFSTGQECEVITVVLDAGATGELDVRWITDIDVEGYPVNNATFEELHRLLSDLNDDETIFGDDDLSMIDATASERQTGVQVKLLGTINISDTVAQHMYGGSVEQGSGNTRDVYSGVGVGVTTPLSSTRPVLIQEDAIITDYWNNAYMPDSVRGNVRIMRKTVEDGVPIDGQRIRGALLEFGELYFFAGTTFGFGEVSLALVSSGDGNNNTAVGTVALYSPVYTEGYQTLDFNEGSGATPFGMSIDFDTNTSLETYEHTKYVQRRGTAETIFGRNAQLFVGFNVNFAYNNETANLTEPEVLAYGTELPYTGGTGTLVAEGEVVEGVTSGALGRVIYVDDTAGTGTIILADVVGTFQQESLTTVRGASEWTATGGAGFVNNSASGQILLAALNDAGTTGNIYGQQLTGTVPANGQTLFGKTSNNEIDVNGTVSTRTVNNQFVGSYTGTNFNPANFGIAIDPTDAIAGDSFTNLLEVTISPPDNRTGTVTNLVIGDRVTIYPWDGATLDVNGDAEPDFNEMVTTALVTGGVSTSVVVGASNIPNNTPATGFLRLERDSDGNYDLLEYSAWTNTTGTFTLVGTAPNTATIGNNLMRAFIDKVAASTSEAYTATYTGPGQQVAITVRRGGSPNPIKTFKTTTTFGSFSVQTVRTPDE